MSADEPTVSYYDRDAEAFAARIYDPHLLADFIAELRPGGHVLDLGCGAGAHSAMLRDAGFATTSVDASARLAAEAKRRWNVDVRMMHFDALDFVEAFDGVWASASLMHARTEDLPSIFAAIRRATRTDGVFHATLKDGVDRRDGRGRYFCTMNESALAALAADWRDVRIDHHIAPGYESEHTHWLRLRARR